MGETRVSHLSPHLLIRIGRKAVGGETPTILSRYKIPTGTVRKYEDVLGNLYVFSRLTKSTNSFLGVPGAPVRGRQNEFFPYQ